MPGRASSLALVEVKQSIILHKSAVKLVSIINVVSSSLRLANFVIDKMLKITNTLYITKKVISIHI